MVNSMIFNCIQIQNFLSIGKLDINLQNRGLVMIEGKNYDNPSLNNNGAGKSSIIEAIVFALYGRTLRGLKGDAVVSRVTGKNMRVCLEITDEDTSQYQIIRQRKCSGSKYLLFKDGVNITPKSEMDFDKYIIQLLQADYQIFTSSLLFSSDSFKISSASDSDIKKAFDTILGLDILAKAHENTKGKLKSALDNQTSYKSQIERLTNRLQGIDSSIQSLIQEQDKFMKDIDFKKEQCTKNIEIYTEELNVLEIELEDIYDDCDDKENHIANLTDELEKVKSQITVLSEYQQKIQDLAQSIKQYELELVKHQSDLNVKHKDLTTLQKQQVNLQTKYSDVQKSIQNAYKQIGQPCKTCGNLLTEDSIKSLISDYTQKLSEIQEELSELDSDSLVQHIQSIQNQINTIQLSLQTDKELKKKYEEMLQTDQTIQKSQLLEKQIVQEEKSLVKLQSEVKLKKSEIKQIKQKISETESQLTNLQNTENPHDKAIQKFQEEQSLIQGEKSELETKLQDLTEYIPRLQFWEHGFSNQGIKSFILDDVTPFLNRRLNKYLSQLTSGQIEAEFSSQTQLKSGEYREKFTLFINNVDGGGQYQANSSGEKKRIDLAINLALQDLVASRAYKKIDIALFDEIFDSLDENGIDGVISLLYELAKEKSTIFVISHNEYLKSYFTNILTIAKKGGISYEQPKS